MISVIQIDVRRRVERTTMHFRRTAFFWLIAPAAVVLLPALLPLGFVVIAVDKRRKQRSAAFFLCLTCGKLLGKASVQLAHDEFRAYVKELLRTHPGVKFRIVQSCHAICPTCGIRYRFQSEEQTFTVEPPQERHAMLKSA